MWRKSLFFLLIITVLSCKSDKDKERERAKYIEDSIARENEEKRFRQNRQRIKPGEAPVKETAKRPVNLLGTLPQKWVLLGIYRSQKVIYIPCGEEEAPSFTLHDINSSNPKIYFNFPDEEKTYFIADVNRSKGIYKFNLVRYYEEEGGMTSTYDSLNVDVVKRGKELIVDVRVHEPGVPKTRFDMIPESEVENYMIVKQDPSECDEKDKR